MTMCEYSCADGDRPSAYKQLLRKARVAHDCCECGGKIAVGETYRFISGIWDGEPAEYKTCEACVSVSQAFIAAHGGERHYLGALNEALSECIDEETSFDDADNEIVTESGKRWQVELDAMLARGAKAVANG